MSKKHPLAEIEVDYVHHTAKAVLINDGEGNEHWVPYSMLEESNTASFYEGKKQGESITLSIPEWLAMEKGLI